MYSPAKRTGVSVSPPPNYNELIISFYESSLLHLPSLWPAPSALSLFTEFSALLSSVDMSFRTQLSHHII